MSSLAGRLIAFGLRQVFDVPADAVVAAVEGYVTDHSRTLPRALERAHDRAWQALGVALGGDGLLDRVKGLFASGDDKGVREQVQAFLRANAAGFDRTPDTLRQACLEDLKRLRKRGVLSAQGLNAADLARDAAGFRRHGDLTGMVEEAGVAVAQVADALAQDYPNLAELLRTPTAAGPPLLASAFCYFFRREVETDDELAHGLFFDGLRHLAASQAKGLGEVGRALDTLGERFDHVIESLGDIKEKVVITHEAVLDLHAELRRLGTLHLANSEEVHSLLSQVLMHLSQAGMQRGEVRPLHSCSIHGEDERRAVRALLARFRQLPAEERQQVPALLNGLGKLQVGVGDFGQAREAFAEVARAVDDPPSKAEAFHNAYRAALEQKHWGDALDALRQAASLEPQRFTPFPLERYRPQRILGAGGFGTAILCHDCNFDEDVVVKTLHAADLDRGLDEVFREARVLRGLFHPAIIGVRDCAYAHPSRQARPYLVMDYFPGGSLGAHVREHGPLGVGDLLAVAGQVAAGIGEAHSRGILHRDLKPDNILVHREGGWRVKVIDFGLALRRQTVETSMARGSEGDTVLGRSVAGTVLYAPPEQMGHLPGIKPGPYSDVYAFGKTCCYALFRTTEPKSRHWAGIPRELAEVLERCTEQELEHRLANFEPVLGVLKALDQARQEEERRQGEEERRRQEEQAEEQKRAEEARQRQGDYQRAMDAGRSALEMHDYPGAVNAFREALRQVPEDRDAAARLTEAERQRDEAAAAEARQRQEEARRREDFNARMAEGRAVMDAGRYQDAVRAFDQAVKLDPGNAEAAQALHEAQQAAEQERLDKERAERERAAREEAERARIEQEEALRLDSNVATARPESLLVPRAKVDRRPPHKPKKAKEGAHPADHFVCYHNVEAQGLSLAGKDLESIGTSKPVERLMGKTVWLVSGEGTPRRYDLTHRFVVDEAGPNPEGGGYFARGKQATVFRPPIPLNDKPWFRDFQRSQSNFSLGVQPIKEKYVAELVKLVGMPPAVTGGGHDPDGDEEPAAWTNSIGMKLVPIPDGEFWMGSPGYEEGHYEDEGPQHEVEITTPFYMGEYTVTRGQFRRFVEEARYQTEAEKAGEENTWREPGFEQTDEHPVVFASWRTPPRGAGFVEQTDEHPVVLVTWNDVAAFCEWLSRKEGKEYRLPTEAEWEFACRAGTTDRFYCGNEDASLRRVANYEGVTQFSHTAPVGSFEPNAWGLHDMHGNVWEWCRDWYAEDYYRSSPRRDPQGPRAGSHRAVRGGSFNNAPRDCRAANRYRRRPASRENNVGFRVVCVR
jgi:formylglycine-generating enzyme required for sulfatase activity/tetratricopeptide (TPR) repeat protein